MCRKAAFLHSNFFVNLPKEIFGKSALDTDEINQKSSRPMAEVFKHPSQRTFGPGPFRGREGRRQQCNPQESPPAPPRRPEPMVLCCRNKKLEISCINKQTYFTKKAAKHELWCLLKLNNLLHVYLLSVGLFKGITILTNNIKMC